MPHNLYCIHADIKSTSGFRAAVTELIRCLPNVLLTKNSVDVVYPHVSILHAQFNCLKDLLELVTTGSTLSTSLDKISPSITIMNSCTL